jgi:hypothetical protein
LPLPLWPRKELFPVKINDTATSAFDAVDGSSTGT